MDVHTIMCNDETGEKTIEFARRTAETLYKASLKSNQIRNVFTEVRKIETIWTERSAAEALPRLNMLKPKLAYQTARGSSMKTLAEVLSQAIDEVVKAPAEKRDQMFRRFMDLFEAILAYHRAQSVNVKL